MKNDSKLAVRSVVAGATGVLATASQAAGTATTIDVSDVLATMTGAVTTVTSIGLASLSLFIVVKLFVWVRGSIK